MATQNLSAPSSRGTSGSITRRRFVETALRGAAVTAAGLWLGPSLARTRAAMAADPAPEFFTPAETATIAAACARIVTGAPGEPGATDVGAVRVIDFLCARTPALRPVYRGGAAGLDETAGSLHGKPFAALPAARRDAILSAVQAGKARGAAWTLLPSPLFFSILLLHTKAAYYTNPLSFPFTGYPGIYDHAHRKRG